ncbi:MAG: hypothetical protein Q8O23_04065, partial [Gallionella sp.]|nr:hypothetical protein [Gallionella sp.]
CSAMRAPQGQGLPTIGQAKRPRQITSFRLPRQSAYKPPEGAKPATPSNFIGDSRSVVPASSVARDWNITARRVRTMLTEGRLSGRQLENGYWEVFYPYQYKFGTRGPEIKRQRNLPPPTRKKRQEVPEQMKDWF